MHALPAGKSRGRPRKQPTMGRREGQLASLVRLFADFSYCYKVDRSGAMRAEWRVGDIAGVDVLPAQLSTEGDWFELVHPDDVGVVRARIDRVMQGKASIDEFRIIIPGHGVCWIRAFVQPEWSDKQGRVVRIVGAAQDISEHKRVELALRESEQRFRDVAESSSDWIWETDAEHRFSYFSQRLSEITGVDGGYWLGKRRDEIISDVAPPGDLQSHLADLAARRPFRNFAYWTEGPMGRRCFSISGKPIFDEAGGFRGYRGTGTDITERKQAEERQSMLLAELDHRVKNTLSVVGSLLRQTRRSSRSPEEFETAFTGRIYALARAHSLLTQNRWTGSGLRELAAQVLAPYQEREGRLNVTGQDGVSLRPQAAVTVSMALHELATNAVKYGSLSVPGGRVDIGWRVETAEAPPRLIIDWQESGGPPVAKPSRRGFGSTLIERGISYELDGRVMLEFAPEGVRCRMDVPLTVEVGSMRARKTT